MPLAPTVTVAVCGVDLIVSVILVPGVPLPIICGLVVVITSPFLMLVTATAFGAPEVEAIWFRLKLPDPVEVGRFRVVEGFSPGAEETWFLKS